MKNSVTDWLTERIFIYPENYDNPHWANGQQHSHTPASPSSAAPPLLRTLPEQCLAKSMSLYMQIFDIRWGVGVRERVLWKGGQFRCFGLLLFSTKFIESPPLFLMKSNALRKSGTAAERLKNVQINFMTAFVCYVHIFSLLHTVSRLLHCHSLRPPPSSIMSYFVCRLCCFFPSFSPFPADGIFVFNPDLYIITSSREGFHSTK